MVHTLWLSPITRNGRSKPLTHQATDSSLSNQNENENRIGETKMPVTMIKRSTLPVLGRGQLGKPAISVRDNGQIAFSTSASKALAGCVYAAVAFDEKTRLLQIQGFAKVPKAVEEADLFKFGKPKEGSTKSKVVYFSGASLLQTLEYDYKRSGSQMFDAEVDETKHIIKITLPKGSLKPKPKQVRAPRSTKAATAGAANGKGKVVEPELEEEPEGAEPELEEVEEA